MGRNRLRNEKLAGYAYDLSKYAGTMIVIGKFVNPTISWINFLGGAIICVMFAVFAYFITPKDNII